MSVYVFIGPSISVDEARKHCDGVFLPPVAQGEIVQLLKEQPKIIGIIDGYFDSVPSVWHKEILMALSSGVHVVGGASMGALRAAELHPFGMVGVGQIFEWYRDGVIDADDEVAVKHADRELNYRSLSEALVNIRKTLQMAQERGIITAHTHQTLIAIGKHIHYPERSYESIIKQARIDVLPTEEIKQLETFVKNHRVDLKKEDAIKVLDKITELTNSGKAALIDFELNKTIYMEELVDSDQTIEFPNDIKVTYEEFVNYARLEWGDFPQVVEQTIGNMLILAFARQQNVSLSEEERKSSEKAFRRALEIDPEIQLDEWSRRNGLSNKGFNQLLDDWALIQKI